VPGPAIALIQTRPPQEAGRRQLQESARPGSVADGSGEWFQYPSNGVPCG
jgi:hypothetical protein